MKKKKLTYHDREVKISVESYQNNGTLALMLVYDNDDSDVITVNLNSRFQSDSMVFLDTNNYPDIEKWIQKNNLGLPMGGVKERSGFCKYPLYTIFTSEL